MNLIDLPAQKEILWTKMRSDLTSLIPQFRDEDVLLCPICCRRIKFEEFSVEHIVPKQALACDPLDARQAIPQNVRSGLTLLCQRPLIIKGKSIPGHGCNSWKGKHYDPFLRDLIGTDLSTLKLNSRHQIALYCAGYLALVREFGFQIVLSAAGRISRTQFFYPNSFLKNVPLNCQMILSGERKSAFNEDDRSYWSEPFSISIDGSTALIMLRNMGFRVPLSHNPTQPKARILPYVPSRFKFRPDLTTFFE